MTLKQIFDAPSRVLPTIGALALAVSFLGCGGSANEVAEPSDKEPAVESPAAVEVIEAESVAVEPVAEEPAAEEPNVEEINPEETTSKESPSEASAEEATQEIALQGTLVESVADKPFVMGDLIEPFEVPSLEELEANVEWKESPVLDGMKLLREQKKSEPALVSVEEALELKNDSDEANEKILSSLSVLQPEDGTGVNYEGTLNRAIQQDLRTLNPLLSSSVAEADLSSLTGTGLFSFDWKMNPFASSDTVVSWQTSSDHMYDKIIMRADQTWSDGKPFTAHDVAFSFQVIMSSQVPVPAMRSGTDQLYWVEAYDDTTLVFFHKKPMATNVWNLNYSVIPKHLYQDSIADDPTLVKSKYHANLERNPVTGGPYVVTHRERGQEVLLTRRESYYMHEGKQVRDKPVFKKIRFRVLEDLNTSLLALKSGSLDEGLLGAEQWITQTGDDRFYKKNTKARGAEWTYFYFGWNLKSPLFEDIRVRKALSHAMNYDEMLEDHCFGLFARCHGMFHPDSWMYPKKPNPLFEYDLDRAEDLLDEAGWADSDGDGIRDKRINGKLVPFEFSMLVSNKPDRIAICNLLREDLETIGIECHIAPIESAVFQERTFNKNFQAYMSGWGSGADPYTNKNIFGSGEERNYGSYSNARVDELFDEGEREFDRERRAEIYGEIASLIYEDQPYTFLYTRSSFYGFSKKLRGYRFSPRGPYHYSPGFTSVWTPSVD